MEFLVWNVCFVSNCKQLQKNALRPLLSDIRSLSRQWRLQISETMLLKWEVMPGGDEIHEQFWKRVALFNINDKNKQRAALVADNTRSSDAMDIFVNSIGYFYWNLRFERYLQESKSQKCHVLFFVYWKIISIL